MGERQEPKGAGVAALPGAPCDAASKAAKNNAMASEVRFIGKRFKHDMPGQALFASGSKWFGGSCHLDEWRYALTPDRVC